VYPAFELEILFCFFAIGVSLVQWRMLKSSKGGAKFCHNRVTSQINLKGSAEGSTILGGSGGMPLGKFCKITPKNLIFVHLEASFRQCCF